MRKFKKRYVLGEGYLGDHDTHDEGDTHEHMVTLYDTKGRDAPCKYRLILERIPGGKVKGRRG